MARRIFIWRSYQANRPLILFLEERNKPGKCQFYYKNITIVSESYNERNYSKSHYVIITIYSFTNINAHTLTDKICWELGFKPSSHIHDPRPGATTVHGRARLDKSSVVVRMVVEIGPDLIFLRLCTIDVRCQYDYIRIQYDWL